MIFESLYASSLRGELILVEGGICHWHLRRDGQVTIREMIVLPEFQNKGIGRVMLKQLCAIPKAKSVVAKCPADLTANNWYKRMGFSFVGSERTRTGRKVNVWQMRLPR